MRKVHNHRRRSKHADYKYCGGYYKRDKNACPANGAQLTVTKITTLQNSVSIAKSRKPVNTIGNTAER